MTVAENLLLAGGRTPALIDWTSARAELRAFLATTPFSLSLDATPASLSAGEKQKLELLKQLYLKPRLLILDEPTSVLTPREADEVLAFVRAVAQRGECTVLMITHKFREVMAYADEVTVLRRGRKVHGAAVASTTPAELALAMIGAGDEGAAAAVVDEGHAVARVPTDAQAPVALEVAGLVAMGDRGAIAVHGLSLAVRRGEILGIAGVSGNGQRELIEAIVGQRPRTAGTVRVVGRSYAGRRSENRELGLRALPEEPLRNASVGDLSVAQNMALRDFDEPPLRRALLPGIAWLRFAAWRARAREWIAAYGIKTRGENAPIASLSGGNVQRAVLARELAGGGNVLIAVNPVFGLDFAAVREIHARILQVRARGAAVLLVSEDLDELLELSDRIAVMSEGRIVFETPAAHADRRTIGAHMGGGEHHDGAAAPVRVQRLAEAA
jgi:simple sugar transport system ATP-binding protein